MQYAVIFSAVVVGFPALGPPVQPTPPCRNTACVLIGSPHTPFLTNTHKKTTHTNWRSAHTALFSNPDPVSSSWKPESSGWLTSVLIKLCLCASHRLIKADFFYSFFISPTCIQAFKSTILFVYIKKTRKIIYNFFLFPKKINDIPNLSVCSSALVDCTSVSSCLSASTAIWSRSVPCHRAQIVYPCRFRACACGLWVSCAEGDIYAVCSCIMESAGEIVWMWTAGMWRVQGQSYWSLLY